MEENAVRVTFESSDATFAEVIPGPEGFVVAGNHEVRPICTKIEIHVVHTFSLSVHGEIWIGGS